jgi:sterol desaturase/sphingolipid hydroxylase (fatty acid hydroxylase superfamily)
MADVVWGERDKRGEWMPDPLPKPGPIFSRPWNLVGVLKYLFAKEGFLWPINLFYVLLAVGSWFFFTPSMSRMVTFQFGWIAEIYLRNAVLLTIVAGGLHLRLYVLKGQGQAYKYTSKWLAKGNKKFLFKNQTWDNIFWNLTSGCIVWTAWEAVTLWLYATGRIPYLEFAAHPVYFVLLMPGVIFLRMFHFYWVHRFIHWGWLYKISHYLHHKNVNIGPWSGLSMHPIEHLLYLSGVLFHWVLLSHPMHAIFHLMHAGISPALGHDGYHRLGSKEGNGIRTDNYFHYLHHRYFTVNFGNESVPLDKWFGSFNDGSAEAQAELLERRSAERSRKTK